MKISENKEQVEVLLWSKEEWKSNGSCSEVWVTPSKWMRWGDGKGAGRVEQVEEVSGVGLWTFLLLTLILNI